MRLNQKLSFIASILLFTLRTYPIRVYRILRHFMPLGYKLGGEIPVHLLVVEWVLSLFLYITDLLLFPEIASSALLLFKRKVRGLSPKEKEIKHLLFEGKLKIPILLNENASLLTNNGKYAFVSFYIINSATPLDERTFAHELIHIWQFARYGSPYIIRALLAQRTPSGYDYGGAAKLMTFYTEQLSQGHFNYEQQGEVLADYFTILKSQWNYTPQKFKHLRTLYEYIVKQWREKEIYRW